MKLNNFSRFIISIIICELAGIVGSFFTFPSIGTWYRSLARPQLAPPNWIFGPVWTTLFALMGIALFLIWSSYLKTVDEHEKQKVKVAITVFGIQLALNILWSIIFFGLHSPGAAFIEIIFLWLAILITIIVFAKISKLAAWLLAPYILWVTFAAYLNFMIWLINRLSY